MFFSRLKNIILYSIMNNEVDCMNFIKKHKQESILLLIVILILLFSGITFAIVWFQGSSDTYGDRLDGIDKVELSDEYIKEAIDAIKKDREYITKVTYNLEGKLLSFLVTVKDETDVNTAKTMSDAILSSFKEEELEFYDIQLFVSDSGTLEESKYPIIAYKHKTSEAFVWSNN